MSTCSLVSTHSARVGLPPAPEAADEGGPTRDDPARALSPPPSAASSYASATAASGRRTTGR